MSNHGTAYSLGQYNEILVSVARALPKALEGTDPKELIKALQKNGEVFEEKLSEYFRALGAAQGEAKKEKSQLLKLLASGVAIPEAPAVKIADCFKVGDGIFAYRDPDFDRWLPEIIPAVDAGNASMFELTKELTFQGMVRMYLGGFPDELEKALIQKGMCFSPKQVDELIRNCEQGSNPLKLRTDGWANFFFVGVGNGVFVVRARRGPGGWVVLVFGFAFAVRRYLGGRVSFRN